jgi:hypothetical protein
MQVLDNTTGEITDKSAEGETYTKDLIVRKSGVTIADTVINGNLIVGQGVGDGDVILDGVTVAKQLVVYGGGSSSVRLAGGSKVDTVVVAKTFGQPVRIVIEADSGAERIIAASGGAVIIAGNVARTEIGADAAVIVQSGTIAELAIGGENASVSIAAGAVVKNAVISASGAKIEGVGKLETATVTADAKSGVAIKSDGAKVSVDAGAGAVATGGGSIAAGSTATSKPDGSTAVSSGGGGGISGGNNGGGNGENNGGKDDDDESLGSVSDPFLIYTEEDMSAVGKNAASGKYEGWDMDSHYKLMADVEVSDWTPIRDVRTYTWEGEEFTYVVSFSGSFDGNGHTVTINGLSGGFEMAGMFGTLASEALVKNLTISGVIENSYISSDIYKIIGTGGIAGMNYGLIENCAAEDLEISSIAGDVGGIAGCNIIQEMVEVGGVGIIRNCVVGSVGNVDISAPNEAGGIVGSASGFVENCTIGGVGNISINADNAATRGNAGGIVGTVYSNGLVLTGCNVGGIGSITISAANYVGGIAGWTGGGIEYTKIQNCVVGGVGAITIISYVPDGLGSDVGGIVGYNNALIDHCDVSGTGDIIIVASTDTNQAGDAGGIAGRSDSSTDKAAAIRSCNVGGAGNIRIEVTNSPASTWNSGYAGGITGNGSGAFIDGGGQILAIEDCVVGAEVGSVTIKSSGYAGGVAGGVYTTYILEDGSLVADCVVNGTVSVTGRGYTGGVVGQNDSVSIERCFVDGISVISETSGAGGVIGRNEGIVRDCAVGSKEDVTIEGQNYAGGIVGTSYYRNLDNEALDGAIEDCTVGGNGKVSVSVPIDGSVTGAAGGIVGENRGLLRNCFVGGTADVEITGFQAAGGIAGENGAGSSGEFTPIEGCVVGGSGNITIISDSTNYPKPGSSFISRAGGIAGVNAMAIRNCLVGGAGNITIWSNHGAGGVVGDNDGSYSAGNGLIENCAVGGKGSIAITVNSLSYGGYAGGVAGENRGGLIKNCAVGGTVSSVSVECSAANAAYLGGVVGDNHYGGNVIAVYTLNTFGIISGTGTTKAGGIVGGHSTENTYWDIARCAALQESIPTAVKAGRVVSETGWNPMYPYVTLSDNYAYDGMTGGSANVENVTQDGLDGADVAKSDLTREFFETTLGWDFGNENEEPWIWSDTYGLPILYWMTGAQTTVWQKPNYLQ